MAVALNDTLTASKLSNAIAKGRKVLLSSKESGGPLWNATVGYFTAHSETKTQLFTDSLYGQMLSHHFLDGEFTVDKGYIEQHLDYEWEQNQDLYGMRVLSSPIQEDSIWMNGPPTWSYLQLALGKLSTEEAYEPFKRMSENFRTRLHDQWNLRALTHTQTEGTELEHGQPREQGHYGFMLTDLYLIPLLSGQNVDLSKGMLALNPMYEPPYILPVMISMMEGQLTATASTSAPSPSPKSAAAAAAAAPAKLAATPAYASMAGKQTQYTLLVAFGALSLPAGGLSVSGCKHQHAITLVAGESVTWNC